MTEREKTAMEIWRAIKQANVVSDEKSFKAVWNIIKAILLEERGK